METAAWDDVSLPAIELFAIRVALSRVMLLSPDLIDGLVDLIDGFFDIFLDQRFNIPGRIKVKILYIYYDTILCLNLMSCNIWIADK